MAFVILAALLLIFVDAKGLVLAGTGALVLFLGLAWRQFGFGTWVPILLSLSTLAVALWSGVPNSVLWRSAERMLFLSALIAMLGTLRSAAALAPEVHNAGLYVTNQPASRRYLAMTFGGHLFGVLINFGGLALLLDIAKRSMSNAETEQLPADVQEIRLKRMTLAVIRGFSLISLWSPFGFATNAILVALPGASYLDFGPIGFAMSFVFIAIGWGYDRWDGRHFRRMGLSRPSPPAKSWIGAALLLCHVLTLGAAVFAVHAWTTLSFQQALIIVVPCYALLWAGAARRHAPGGAVSGIGAGVRTSWQRLPNIGTEIGVFASAGFLPVVLLALIPQDTLRNTISALGLGPVPMAFGLAISIVLMALVGVNPIVTASVLGAIATQLTIPGLSDTAIALAITGGWTAVIGLSPFITTLVICSSIVGRPAQVIGPKWNGPYCLTILLVWIAFLTGLMLSGLI